MPKYAKRRRSKRKPIKSRRRKGGRRRGRRGSRVISRRALFPPSYLSKMKYSALHQLSFGGAGTPAVYLYRANSIYDPDYTGTGHQPYGHDEMALIYNRYRVFGVKYKITFTNQSAVQQEIVVQHRPNDAFSTDIDLMFEQPSTKHRLVLDQEGSGQGVKQVRGYMSVAAARGVSKMEVNTDDGYAAAFGANPIHSPCLVVALANQNALQTSALNVRYDLTYYVKCYDRKLLAKS